MPSAGSISGFPAQRRQTTKSTGDLACPGIRHPDARSPSRSTPPPQGLDLGSVAAQGSSAPVMRSSSRPMRSSRSVSSMGDTAASCVVGDDHPWRARRRALVSSAGDGPRTCVREGHTLGRGLADHPHVYGDGTTSEAAATHTVVGMHWPGRALMVHARTRPAGRAPGLAVACRVRSSFRVSGSNEELLEWCRRSSASDAAALPPEDRSCRLDGVVRRSQRANWRCEVRASHRAPAAGGWTADDDPR